MTWLDVGTGGGGHVRCPRLAARGCIIRATIGTKLGCVALWHGVHGQLSASYFYFCMVSHFLFAGRFFVSPLLLVTFSSVLCPLLRRQQGFAVGSDAFRVRTRQMLKLLVISRHAGRRCGVALALVCTNLARPDALDDVWPRQRSLVGCCFMKRWELTAGAGDAVPICLCWELDMVTATNSAWVYVVAYLTTRPAFQMQFVPSFSSYGYDNRCNQVVAHVRIRGTGTMSRLS